MNRTIVFLIGAAVLAVGLFPRAADAALTWEDALARAEARGDRLLVVVEAPWCGAGADVTKKATRDLRVDSALRDGWILLSVNADRRPDLRRLLHGPLSADLPSLHFLDSGAGRMLRSDPLDAPALLNELERLGSRAPPGARLVREAAPEAPARTPAATYDRALRDFRETLAPAGNLDPATPLTADDVSLLVDLAQAEPAIFAEPLAAFLSGVMASERQDAAGGFRAGSGSGKPLEVQAVMMEALLADARVNPERASVDREAVEATVGFLNRHLLDPATGLFHASMSADGGSVDPTFLLSANARTGAALRDAGRLFKKRDWVKAGDRVQASLPRVLVDDRRNLLHWRGPDGSGPSQPEDWVEWGRLLMGSENPADHARAREAVVTLRDRFVDPARGLLPRPAEEQIRGVPVAPLGNDAARAIRFLADWADWAADGEITFLAMGLLDRLATEPGASPASVALAARPMARQ